MAPSAGRWPAPSPAKGRGFLAGRTLAKLDAVAGEIRAAGGTAETARVDALYEKAVDEHADRVAAEAGSKDVSLNLITHPSCTGHRWRRWRSRTTRWPWRPP